jgi:hypothetical protein
VTLRAIAALLWPILAAATRPIERSADSVAAEPSGADHDDDGQPRPMWSLNPQLST